MTEAAIEPEVQYPLRERRKRRTRAALVDAARHLFAAQGFHDTTLEQIAAEADVHVQTLYRHFPSKEALALAPERERLEAFRARAEDAGRSTGTLELWRRWVEAWAREVTEQCREGFLERVRNRDRAPSLTVAHLHLWLDYEDVLTAALARDLGRDPEQDRLPRLIACMLWGGHQAAVRSWAHHGGTSDLKAEVLAVIDDVGGLFGAELSGRGHRARRVSGLG